MRWLNWATCSDVCEGRSADGDGKEEGPATAAKDDDDNDDEDDEDAECEDALEDSGGGRILFALVCRAGRNHTGYGDDLKI
jgi:hypothetical protein